MYTILRLGVYDGPGVLDRIAGFIRRGGSNITSINAGRFKSGIAQINIVLSDERVDVSKMGKQLYDINFVSDYKVFSAENSLIRELALIRMRTADFDPSYWGGARILRRDDAEISFEITGTTRELEGLLQPVQDKLLDFVRSGALALSTEGAETV